MKLESEGLAGLLLLLSMACAAALNLASLLAAAVPAAAAPAAAAPAEGAGLLAAGSRGEKMEAATLPDTAVWQPTTMSIGSASRARNCAPAPSAPSPLPEGGAPAAAPAAAASSPVAQAASVREGRGDRGSRGRGAVTHRRKGLRCRGEKAPSALGPSSRACSVAEGGVAGEALACSLARACCSLVEASLLSTRATRAAAASATAGGQAAVGVGVAPAAAAVG